jgi:hypothetical protein
VPYSLKGNCVVRSDTGAVVKEHPTRAKALAHLRALKVNVESQESELRWLDEHAEEWLELSGSGAARHGQARHGAVRRGMAWQGSELVESEKTAGYSSTPSPLSRSKTSNWVARVGGLPNYVQHIAKALMRSGKSESVAIATAIATVKRWAAGGGKVHPEVRAAAAKAVAEWEAKRAASHAKSG